MREKCTGKGKETGIQKLAETEGGKTREEGKEGNNVSFVSLELTWLLVSVDVMIRSISL
jgi:hypothetical protein